MENLFESQKTADPNNEFCRITNYLKKFKLHKTSDYTRITSIFSHNITINKYINEFWTSKQRQGSSIHEVSYRACFKPQLPKFFINLFTKENDIVYDPFSGRGTTLIEAALNGRIPYANDVNPLSEILSRPRIFPPEIESISNRLNNIDFNLDVKSEINLSMFYHSQTLKELISLRRYLFEKSKNNTEDEIDRWIRMVATNRLTGHSKGFFSVYTLPPNQATSAERQIKINEKRKQVPEYRNVKEIIIRKSKQLLSKISDTEFDNLNKVNSQSKFYNGDARFTNNIEDGVVQLTVTSPPFLDIVHYSKDNWLRCWFNHIDDKEIEKKITMSKKLLDWNNVMQEVMNELFRITKIGGWVAFEVGEVRNGTIKLDEEIIPLGLQAGFNIFGVLINEQVFTKTSNIWGIDNNKQGTNTNRIVLFQKDEVKTNESTNGNSKMGYK